MIHGTYFIVILSEDNEGNVAGAISIIFLRLKPKGYSALGCIEVGGKRISHINPEEYEDFNARGTKNVFSGRYSETKACSSLSLALSLVLSPSMAVLNGMSASGHGNSQPSLG